MLLEAFDIMAGTCNSKFTLKKSLESLQAKLKGDVYK